LAFWQLKFEEKKIMKERRNNEKDHIVTKFKNFNCDKTQ